MWILWVILAFVVGTLAAGPAGGIACGLIVLAIVFIPFFGLAGILDYMSPYHMSRAHQAEYDEIEKEAERRRKEFRDLEKRYYEYWNERPISAGTNSPEWREWQKEWERMGKEYMDRKLHDEWFEVTYPKLKDDLDRKYYGDRYDEIMSRRKHK